MLWAKKVFPLVALAFVFLLTRIYNILDLPIFNDEAIYIQWAQTVSENSSLRFISLVDGKQPLFIWLMAPLLSFINEPLLAGRLVSIFAGLTTMIGLFFLTKEIFKSYLTGIISSIIYIIYPFALVLDRLAIYDSLVGSFAVWGMFFGVLLARFPRLDLTLILGFILGGGILTKTSAFFSLYLLPLTAIFVNFKSRKSILRKWSGFIFISLILAYAHYNILRLSPNFFQISQKNGFFVNDFSGFLLNKFYLNFFQNLATLSAWIVSYFTLPMILLIIASFLISKKFLKEKIFLLIWFFIPLLALTLFGRVFFPRFIFFMTLYLIPLISFSFVEILSRMNRKALFMPFLLILLFPMIKTDYFVLTDFKKAPIPTTDLNQFINDWPSGAGIKEAILILKKESKDKKIFVISEGIYGSLPTTSLDIYLKGDKNIQRSALEPIPQDLSLEDKEKTCKYETFLLLNQMQSPPATWPAQLVLKQKKGLGNSYLTLYKLGCFPNL